MSAHTQPPAAVPCKLQGGSDWAMSNQNRLVRNGLLNLLLLRTELTARKAQRCESRAE